MSSVITKKKAKGSSVQPDSQQTSPGIPAEPSAAQKELDFRHTLDRVRHAANQGDQRAQRAIKECLRNSPNLCAEFGDAVKHAETALIELISGGESLTSEAIGQQIAKMKRDLAGPSPTLLAEMSAQRVVACWLQLQYAEVQFLQTQQNVQWARYWLARQAQADKLYRAALKSFILIRELLPNAGLASAPAVVNAGSQTVPPAAKAKAKLPAPTEHFTRDAPWVNRIAGLMAGTGDLLGGSKNSKSLNGHGQRLEGLLEPCGG